MVVVGSAASGEEAISQFSQLLPDVTLIDLKLGCMSGLEAITVIRRDHPHAKIVVLTAYEGEEDVFRALDAGAASYLVKSVGFGELTDVIRRVHAGERPIGADVQARLRRRATRAALTSREIEVLELIAMGMTNACIAQTLAISRETVAVHLQNVYRKLKVKKCTAAVAIAVARGIIRLRIPSEDGASQ